ncbi:hypothetical protein M0805_007861 [Coniferiporia weirii]|nr:hypothetical protein M0805_007861 [Coniferiporia weirii]
MAPKEPTRYQVSSRLAYSQSTPDFLQRLKNRVAGVSDDGGNNDEYDEFDEWQSKSGRPPIPRRPSPPQRPEDDPGSADEDALDEKPQVVVLKEGKHMTAREAENEKRKAKGLPPIPDEPQGREGDSTEEANRGLKEKAKSTEKDSSKSASLSFSSSGASSSVRSAGKKRKTVGDDQDDIANREKADKKTKKTSKIKKAKTGTLLSFGDENDD